MKELKFDILFDIANRMSKLSNREKSKVMLEIWFLKFNKHAQETLEKV